MSLLLGRLPFMQRASHRRQIDIVFPTVKKHRELVAAGKRLRARAKTAARVSQRGC
jgi:hypothetical protein